MKKILLFLMLVSLTTQAKTTYIPTYDNRLIIMESGESNMKSNTSHTLLMQSMDSLVTISLAQQVVSQELVCEIKRAKSAEGWAMVAAGFSSFSQGMAQSQMNNRSYHNKGWAMQNYIDSRENTKAAIEASAEAKAKSEVLKTLLLDLVVRNNSQKEMLITDMDRGLVWFVSPSCEVRLPLIKDEESHFRISSCNPLDENVKYINALGTSTLEKYTIGLETDRFWYVPISEKNNNSLRFVSSLEEGYIKIDKETMEMYAIGVNEFKELKDSVQEYSE